VDEVVTLSEAIHRRGKLRAAGGKLVFTNGHFDLLHIGHLEYLEKARTLGDALYVGVNGDSSTGRLKGAGRPLVPALERARLLAALIPVNAVMIFEEDTAIALIEALQPEIYVKGGDYDADGQGVSKSLPERPAVEAYGGQVHFIDYLPGHSTSELIRRVKALPE
jgi:rfaE bifunctional protein nucleotidyltransferase chain/domain